MRAALRTFPARPATMQGRPAVQVLDPRNDIEYWVEIAEEPDAAGRYSIKMLLCKPQDGARIPDSIPHRTLSEIAAEMLQRREKPARGGNRYKGPDPKDLRRWVEEGLSRGDIAKRLDRSPATVDSWLKRARRLDPTFPTTLTAKGVRRAPSRRQATELAAMRAAQRRPEREG
uniref:RNA polymerase sigma factor 70 region 4 type 2 domain-containing protein n=1 Tax=Dulem virus 38 TaxID=3145756 RepID=A0AAU8B2D2_9CAUD